MTVRVLCQCNLRSHWTGLNQFTCSLVCSRPGTVEKGKTCAGIKRGVTHCGRRLPRVKGGQGSRAEAECLECCLQPRTLKTGDHTEIASMDLQSNGWGSKLQGEWYWRGVGSKKWIHTTCRKCHSRRYRWSSCDPAIDKESISWKSKMTFIIKDNASYSASYCFRSWLSTHSNHMWSTMWALGGLYSEFQLIL